MTQGANPDRDGERADLQRRIAELERDTRLTRAEIDRMRTSRVWRMAGRYWRARRFVGDAVLRLGR